MTDSITLHTDGSCLRNPGPGGWAAVLQWRDEIRELSGAVADSTNNRMELKAAIEGLNALKRPMAVDLHTDSKYVMQGVESWMPRWKLNGWRTAAKKPVLNQDLWQALDQARLAEVPLSYVKGHSGDPDNDRVDQIAVAYSKGRNQTPPASASRSASPSGASPQPSVDSAPVSLQKLLTRMELADRLASGGYALSAVELAQLVEQPLNRLAERQGSWRWRDWQVEPIENDRWRLRRDPSGSKQT